jgi:peroxiredoxin/outer membrane protein assembly factor BamD (BamD/ComL family)
MRANRWYHLVIVLIGLVLLSSCVSSTLNETRSTSATAAHGYNEIKTSVEKLSEGGAPADYETLIEKSRAFIKAHPKYRQVDEIYFYLGAILVQLQRTDEGIAVLEELIKDYPSANYVEPSLLTLGLAYDKVSAHDKADALYEKLVNHSKYRIGRYAETARQLLEQDRTARKGELSGSSKASPNPSQSPSQFINKPAPDFQVMDIMGEELSLEQYRGQVVLLDFWATWCGPCIAEMPNVKNAYEKYKNRKFQIIGISLDNAMEPLDAYIKGEGITWRQYLDRSGKISTLYDVRAIPSTFLIDSAGIVRKVNLRGPALETAVAGLVRENLGN